MCCAAFDVQILQSWQALAMPFAYRCAFVLGPGSHSSTAVAGIAQNSNSSDDTCKYEVQAGLAAAEQAAAAHAASPPPPAAAAGSAAAAAGAVATQLAVRQAPWSDRVQCQSHIALLACLHQYHEDEPAAAEQQQEVLADESIVLQAGFACLPAG